MAKKQPKKKLLKKTKSKKEVNFGYEGDFHFERK